VAKLLLLLLLALLVMPVLCEPVLLLWLLLLLLQQQQLAQELVLQAADLPGCRWEQLHSYLPLLRHPQPAVVPWLLGLQLLLVS
jgi:hypothetical protein